ncbi:MAG TPA: alpha/beta hydrolase [Streptosporangiaceae bacterium]|nr:alpha/beta hydrolase [Streptosporangiaceae bacterium]
MKALHTVAAVAAAVTVGIGSTSACAGTGKAKETSPPPGAPSGLASYYKQKPRWTNCQGGFQCATVKVPLDYARPGAGGDVKLSVIRLPAKNKSQRIGSLVTNPGGPGGSGVEFVRGNAMSFSQALRDRFDLIGFDPRGVGGSAPVRCLTGKQLDSYFATDSSPDDKAEIDKLLQQGRTFAGGCRTRSARLLPYVGTINAARDMDVLRAALGDKQLTYFGASYGTYLGAFYAEQFPKNVRALVLDGAIDPKLSAAQINLEQAKGFERALRAFAADCARSSGCPLGNDTSSVLNKISGLLDRADKSPLNNGLADGRVVNEPMVATGIAAALYQKEAWPTLRVALGRAGDANDGTLLLKLADLLTERKEDGSYSNLMESNMAVNCVDKPFPADPQAYESAAADAKKAAPRFGPFIVWGSLPCAYWPAKTSEKPRALTAAGAKPILVIGTTRDPATPYSWAKGLASQLQSGVLLSLDGDGHTAYLAGNRCIGQYVDRYLIEGIPPKNGTMCR